MSGITSSRLLARGTLERRIAEIEQAPAGRSGELLDLKSEVNKTSLFNSMFPLCVASEIFNLVKETQDTTDVCSLPVPFILGRVCRAWRETVRSDTRLWDTIIIRLSPHRFAEQEQLLQDWLVRSGQYRPLYCHIHFTNGGSKWKPPLSFAKLILKTSSRWRVFECFPNIPSLSQELHKAGNNFPSLVTLNIYHSPCFKLDFLTATRLQNLIIAGQNMLQVTLLVNWGQLTSLEILQEIEITAAMDIVWMLVNVQYLSLRLTITPTSVLSRITEAAPELTHLSHLILHVSNQSRLIPIFLDSMASPALTHLILSFGDPSVDADGLVSVEYHALAHIDLGATFDSFLHRSPFSLERCTISYPICWTGIRMEVMKRIAALVNLSINPARRNRSHYQIDMSKDARYKFLPLYSWTLHPNHFVVSGT